LLSETVEGHTKITSNPLADLPYKTMLPIPTKISAGMSYHFCFFNPIDCKIINFSASFFESIIIIID